MRLALYACLLLLPLSGCLSSDDAPPQNEVETPAADASPPSTYVNQAMVTQEVNLTPGTPAGFEVLVPEGARNITMSGAYTQASMVELTLDLDGCGSATYDAVVVAGVVGTFSPIPVCAEAAAGSHLANVTATGAYVGTVTLHADVPQ